MSGTTGSFPFVMPSCESTKGRLYLVDLAGSERVKKSAVTGTELREAQYINRSLSALGDVMEALDSKASYIPYRNSRLTYLLQVRHKEPRRDGRHRQGKARRSNPCRLN